MSGAEAEEYITKGFSALDNDHFHLALVCFERAAALTTSPLVSSALGLCLAAVRGEFDNGIALCRQAIADEPGNTSHYYHLGRTLLLVGTAGRSAQRIQAGAGDRQGSADHRRTGGAGDQKAPCDCGAPPG